MGERLGQHFLKSRSALRHIAETLELRAGDTVIEIGPGHGELTMELLKTPDVKVIAIEKDRELVTWLLSKLVDWKNVEIIHSDALKTLPQLTNQLTKQQINYKLTGNIPFYLTGRLLRIVGELEQKPARAVFTVQREVAERAVAEAPHMNLLAATIRFWAKARIAGNLPRRLFSPPPKVDSAILLLIPQKPAGNPERYYPLVRALFKQPRKTVSNNLSAFFGKGEKAKTLGTRILIAAGVNPSNRPQNLSMKELLALAANTEH